VNPQNGEGIDYGLETGRLAAKLPGSGDLSMAWPAVPAATIGVDVTAQPIQISLDEFRGTEFTDSARPRASMSANIQP
jgi:hypothetical protein